MIVLLLRKNLKVERDEGPKIEPNGLKHDLELYQINVPKTTDGTILQNEEPSSADGGLKKSDNFFKTSMRSFRRKLPSPIAMFKNRVCHIKVSADAKVKRLIDLACK